MTDKVEKNKSVLRWVILFLTCLMMIGNYYAYDIPAALHTQLKQKMSQNNPENFETFFSLLYTVYSLPNIVLPFFGGYFVDKLGVRLCLLVFTSCLLLGASVFAIGLSSKSWSLMFIGRVIYGFGGESLSVGNSAVLAEWFKGSETAFAFGLNLSIARLGSVINNLVSPRLATSAPGGVVFALWFGSMLTGMSVVCAFLIGTLNSSYGSSPTNDISERLLDKDQLEEADPSLNSVQKKIAQDKLEQNEGEDEEVKFSDVLSFNMGFWLLALSCLVVYGCVLPFNNIASALLLERDFFIPSPTDCSLSNPLECESDFNQPNYACPESTKYRFYQPPIPLNVSINDELFDNLMTTDIDCSDDSWSKSKCFQTYCDDLSTAVGQAGVVMSIPFIISATLSPFLGGFVDKFGMRAVIATIAPAALMIVHGMLGFSSVGPVGPLVGQGLSYAMFASVIWPSVPLVIEDKYTGLGFGIVTAIQNGGLAMFPLIIAKIYSSSGAYIPSAEVFFVSLAALGVAVGLALNYYDCTHNYVFNAPKKAATTDIQEFASVNAVADDDEKGRLSSSRLFSESR